MARSTGYYTESRCERAEPRMRKEGNIVGSGGAPGFSAQPLGLDGRSYIRTLHNGGGYQAHQPFWHDAIML